MFKSSFADEGAVASIIFPAYLRTYWDTICVLGLRDELERGIWVGHLEAAVNFIPVLYVP